MNLEQAQAAHRAAVENHQNLRAKADAAAQTLQTATAARAELLKSAAQGEAVAPGALAKAQSAIDAAETDAAGWREAAEIAGRAEQAAKRQLDLESQIEALTAYRAKCEARAALADDVAAKIQAAREALKTLERLDAEVAASAPKHIIVMGGLNTIAARLLQNLDQPSLRGIYNPPRQRDDVLAGSQALPSGTGHLAEIDREIARAREVAMLDARRRTAA